jgi:pyruvate dehydrogenase E1 component
VLTVKYGQQLERLFIRPGGDTLRRRIDRMSNPEYQRLLRRAPADLRRCLPGDGQEADAIAALIAGLSDDDLAGAVRNLGGHDFGALGEAFGSIDDTRPTIIFAYTIKGYGLTFEGHPQNHSALLTPDQLAELGCRLGADPAAPWARFADDTQEAELCRQARSRLIRAATTFREVAGVPPDLGRTPAGTGSTQAALGRTLLDLARAAPGVARHIVTVSPDVSSSTNLGGWINKVGVWAPHDRTDWFADDAETVLRWRERTSGQHIELGIAETNLVGVIGELGATWSRWGVPLIPIGVLYDPFVERALEPWSFGIYAGGQSILVGTPSGVTLAPEGGAHQSIKTASIGIEQPGCVAYEPAFAIDTEWMLLSAMARIGRPGGTSTYLRLSTRPVDQDFAAVPADPAARDRRRRQAIAGAYALRRVLRPDLTLCAMGPLVVEALAAADRLTAQGFATDVVCITSPDMLFRAMQARRGLGTARDDILEAVFPAGRAAPMVTVVDGHPHALAFLAGVHGTPATHLGVTAFGQSGDIDAVYRHHQIDTASVIGAALDLVD